MNTRSKARLATCSSEQKKTESGVFRKPQETTAETTMGTLSTDKHLHQASHYARFLIEAREWMKRDLSPAEVSAIVKVMTTSEFPEVPFILWSLLSKHPENLFRLHPHVQDFLVSVTDKPKPDLQEYLDTHLNRVNAKKFPVYALLVEWQVVRFSVERNRFFWP